MIQLCSKYPIKNLYLDRGYENFESKLKNLGVKIIREISKNTFEQNGYKIEPKSGDLSKLEAA